MTAAEYSEDPYEPSIPNEWQRDVAEIRKGMSRALLVGGAIILLVLGITIWAMLRWQDVARNENRIDRLEQTVNGLAPALDSVRQQVMEGTEPGEEPVAPPSEEIIQDPDLGTQQPEIQDPEKNDPDPNDPDPNDAEVNDPDPFDDPDPNDPEIQNEEIPVSPDAIAQAIEAFCNTFGCPDPVDDPDPTDNPDPTDDPEIQEPEIQDDEIQDPEIQDPEIDDPDPNGFDCPAGTELRRVKVVDAEGGAVDALACVILETR